MDREYMEDVMESGTYVRVPHELFSYFKPFTACVFSYIYGFLKKNMAVYGGNKKIAEVFNVDVGAIRRATNELVEKGFLVKKRGQRGVEFGLPTNEKRSISQSAKCTLEKAIMQEANKHYPHSETGNMHIPKSANCRFPNVQYAHPIIKDSINNTANNTTKVTDYCAEKEFPNVQNAHSENNGEDRAEIEFNRIVQEKSVKHNVSANTMQLAVFTFIGNEIRNVGKYNDATFEEWFNSPAGKREINTSIDSHNKEWSNHPIDKLQI